MNAKDNRRIPPLRYPLVHALKHKHPDLWIAINGGIRNPEAVAEQLAAGLDEVMIGRWAWDDPLAISRLPGGNSFDLSQALQSYRPHLEESLDGGESLSLLLRPLNNLFRGQRGARKSRRVLAQARSLLDLAPLWDWAERAPVDPAR